MAEVNQNSITEKNLDRLADFLVSELKQPELAAEIPNGAHIFHGAYHDMELTRANLGLAAMLLIGMAVGLRDEAPVVMLFEYRAGQQAVVELSTVERRRKVQEFAEKFQEQHKQDILTEINALMA